jgi:SnoaL-like domain
MHRQQGLLQRLQKTSALLTLIVAAACSIAIQSAVQIAPDDGLASIRLRLAQLESGLHKAQALRDIKRLQYSYAHYAESGLWLDLGDLFATNGVAHYAQGDFRGPESLRKFYLQELGRGQLGLAEGRIYPHIMIQPVVTIAEDGKTARGRWHVIAMLGSYGASASWAGVVYENRYVFEDAVWKISELSYSSQYSGRYSPPGLSISKWDLPYHFTAQSAGAPLANSALSASADSSLTSANFERLQQRWSELARRAQELRDETDVLNLQHSYGYYFDQKMWAAVASLFASDGTMELGLRGVSAGRDRIRRALNVIRGERLDGDEVNDHLQLATVVHIAPDGRTAKARGIELSVSGTKGRGAQWEEGIFENEYLKVDGIWKIRTLHYYPRVITDYELGWAKDAKPTAGPSTEFPPDRPSTEAYGIYPKMYYPRFHYPNPVTRMPVQYPPGITATLKGPDSKQGSLNNAVLPSPPKTVKEFTARLAELEKQLHSSIAYDAAENLVSAHGYYLDDSRDDELQRLFSNVSERRSPRNTETGNSPTIHQTVQPVIRLAPDGKSATIQARLLNVGGKAGELESGVYEGRAVILDGTWKFQSLTLKQTWSSPFSRWMPLVERGH